MTSNVQPDPDRIAEHWRNQRYEDLRSFTRMPHPMWLQETGQRLLHEGMFSVLNALTAEARPFSRAVDIGCGVGDWTAYLADLADEVVGVEICESFLEEAHRRNVAANVRFEQADLRTWRDFRGDDLVSFGSCWNFVADVVVEDVLTTLSEVQQPGSFIYVRATAVHGDRRPTTSAGGYYRAVSQYLAWFERYGYEVLFEQPSAAVVALYGVNPPGLSLTQDSVHRRARRAGTPMAWILKAMRERDYYNWVLRKR